MLIPPVELIESKEVLKKAKKWLTRDGNFDNLEKFAQNVTSCSVTLKTVEVELKKARRECILAATNDDLYSAIKFEDTNLA